MAAISKLVRWLPQAVEATADDIAKFGPQAGRVRELLKFADTVPNKSLATTIRIDYSNPKIRKAIEEMNDVLGMESTDVSRALAAERAGTAGTDVGSKAWSTGFPDTVAEAAMAESTADLLSPASYRILTGPLNAGRAVDLLRARPRYQGTPFLDVVQNLAERGAITVPRDVVRAGRISRAPEDVREIALTLIADGMSPADALRAARML